MARKPVIAIIGAGREVEPAVSHARELGRMVAENGWVLITGGRDRGVMKAANQGAKQAKEGLTIGIIPDRIEELSPSVDVAIITQMGQARNNIIALSADVVIACGVDGAGTASEVALALKNGKEVILLGSKGVAAEFFSGLAVDRVHVAKSCENAIGLVAEILDRNGQQPQS